MLLGNKKSEKTETNWCLILNPLFSEIDKRKIARKISDAFGLSPEEAEDLVNNTPIILLDNLTRPIAQQVKDYFRPTGANILMTNEVFVKRKCYRTVWPEPPSLSFLNQKQEPKPEPTETDSSSERLHPDEALNEIRSLNDQEEENQNPDFGEIKQTVSDEENEQLMQQLDLLKKEKAEWQSKFESQRRTLEKMGWEMTMRDSGLQSGPNQQERERELERQKALMKAAEERYEALQEEYQQARNLFEEKLRTVFRESQEWKEKFDLLDKEVKSVKGRQTDDAGKLQEALNTQEEWRQKLQIAEEKSAVLQREYDTLRMQMKETSTAAEQTRSKEISDKMKFMEDREAVWTQQRDALMAAAKKEEERRQLLEQEYRGLRALTEEKMRLAERETNEWKFRYEEIADKMRTLEKGQKRLIEELEGRRDEINQWQMKTQDLSDTMNQLRNSHDNLEKMLSVNLKHLESREKELEVTRRQLKEMRDHVDHKDSIQKRSMLATIITEKEARLNQLIEDQQRVENEIRTREDSIRKILSEQQRIEKEILDGKQSQRHFLEQIKKDKAPKYKSLKDEPPSDE